MVHADDFSDPTSAVLIQDLCFSERGVDFDRWIRTAFVPVTLVANGQVFVLTDEDEMMDHLKAIEITALRIGLARFETEIQSFVPLGDTAAVFRSIRRRYDKDNNGLGASSITWGVIRVGGEWKINQVLFNDTVHDPSIVAQTFLGFPNKQP